MNRPDITFDHDADCIKHRELGKGVTYEQDGVLFSSGFVALKVLKTKPKKDKFDNMSPAELRAELRGKKAPAAATSAKSGTAKPQTPRQGADDKLAGFRNEDNPDYVRQALSENHAAATAEENVQ